MICAGRAISFISLLTLAASLPLSKRENWYPNPYYPDKYARWCSGSFHHLKWYTQDMPAGYRNLDGSAFLIINGVVDTAHHELAVGFPLSFGEVGFTVPNDVPPGMYNIDFYTGGISHWTESFYIGHDGCL